LSIVASGAVRRVQHLRGPVRLDEQGHVQDPLVHARLCGHVDDLLDDGLELEAHRQMSSTAAECMLCYWYCYCYTNNINVIGIAIVMREREASASTFKTLMKDLMGANH
jgi:hypothetical protein